ncbi:NDT80 / PhoG like DNA-binding family protein [Coccidioides posadasii C735 delta SOWgp]|uniref:PHOG protein n=2 Tax=Coccidioides posadasii TaxID=199306 RepID=A0A0J6FKC9_COCPO|nr:NDT80 / PhoG like DNA-binding family protein [Coccidioides posadasii C735 delta SOWgp]EER29657.1 NDT80 / PhoG like DNA-binding family protein [Coccidioides posadasii C735 delta SOWgp]KMM69885.1 PHOG protein [Coccidioides posadasii RMSCC 3488]|eukprot:XP_003071802.1 NDT80 / PhoG like DNA-binding family protein [Coccidioides posadasii C735 delta SOWgp]
MHSTLSPFEPIMDYDSSMPYLASPLSMGNLQNVDYLNAMQPLDIPPHPHPYDHEAFASGDDMSFSQPSLTHPMRRFSSNQYDEPFPDILSQFEPLPPEQPPQDSSVDHNHKLLSFSLPIYGFTLLDYSLRKTSLSMSAQLHGMFFLAESPWTTSPTSDTNIPPPVAELTCYRRNLFQITGSVTLPRGLRYILTEHGDRIPILAHELTVSATESVEGNSVKIISVPWKTPATNTTGQPEDKTEKEPPSIPLDTMTGQDLDSDYATFSIAWKRLQFRIATANNGRRKELQQHFVVRLKIVATLSTGTKVPIAEAHSGPVIVRGRSPRNFQSRKDLPLSGSAAASRKNAQAAALHRANTADAARSHQAAAKRSKSPQGPTPAPVPLKLDTDAKPSSPQQQPPPSATLPDWTHVTSAPTSTTPFSAPPVTGPTAASAAYAKSSPEQPRPGKRRRTSASTKPISLSLADDVPSPATPTTPVHINSLATTSAPHFTNTTHPIDNTSLLQKHSPQVTANQAMPHTYSTSANMPLLAQSLQQLAPPLLSPHIVNPSDTADLLYEYFPLGLDDWQAPVDAVYRPHVVHHMNLPDDPKAIAARNRSKRYFAGEGS